MPTLNVADFYQDEEYSDVILKYSDRTLHAHKFTICRASEYFKKLCGPGSAFAESEAKVIELKDDIADAFDAVLRYIYTGKWFSDKVGDEYQKRSWQFNVDVSVTANKYMIDTLSKIALTECKSLINKLTDVQEVFDALEKMPEYQGYDSAFTEIAANLREKNLKGLLKLPAFRAQLETKTEDMWEMIDRLSFAVGLEKNFFTRCLRCGECELSSKPPTHASHNCGMHHYSQPSNEVTECWVEKRAG
ncbi:hypothetical protein EJ03DRAFT_10165 [Teratosphaeria nubilosa]|uniref:BTB domain-containing protein n=1 Tax=Teratosphaeria nubilosa TaxID=161662 RepID=A0A6G1LG30_9PEZI|nr:hypothetical protein EJ03DRAFT_10165 [Teratosphaeria nubilosa]